MGVPTSNDPRCPACDAAVRPDADWCTLCYADLRPPAPEPVVEPALLAPQPAPEDLATTPAHDRPRGRHARRPADGEPAYAVGPDGAPPDRAMEALEAEADAMLAMLAAESGPPLGAVSRHLESSRSRAVIAVGGVVGLSLLGWLLLAVLGALL